MSFAVVGLTKTCKRLAVCATKKDAESYVGTLPFFEEGIYYIDWPCNETIVIAETDVEGHHAD